MAYSQPPLGQGHAGSAANEYHPHQNTSVMAPTLIAMGDVPHRRDHTRPPPTASPGMRQRESDPYSKRPLIRDEPWMSFRYAKVGRGLSNPANPGDTVPQEQSVNSTAGTKSRVLNDAMDAPRKKSISTSRTGQACDRCKQRKIKCDASPGGCGPCSQNHLACTTTDRITQRAAVRGHTENIERENQQLRERVTRLERLLAQTVSGSGSHNITSDPLESTAGCKSDYQYRNPSPSSVDVHVGDSATSETKGKDPPRGLPAAVSGANEDDHLVCAQPHTGHVKGTVLCLFGMKIDLADFVQEAPGSPASYQTMTSIILGSTLERSTVADLWDSYEEVVRYAESYFSVPHRTLPVLHEESFKDLFANKVYRMFHDETFKADCTLAELVTVHMVLAIAKWAESAYEMQSAGRFDSQNRAMQSAYQHYLQCLKCLPELMNGRTLKDLQAIVLICIFVRLFELPGPAWMLTSLALLVAKDAGLHRSVNKCCPSAGRKYDILTAETRKCVFWTLLLLHVTLSAKLGRQLQISPQDFDVEHMLALNRDMVVETADNPCNIKPAIALFKLAELYMEMYPRIYSSKSSAQYDATVREMESKVAAWEADCPTELTWSASEGHRGSHPIFALWVQLFYNEFHMMFHHPALCRSQTVELANEHLRRCMEACSNIIDIMGQLHHLRALDTSWQALVVYIAATFNLIYGYSEQKDALTMEDYLRLEKSVTTSLDAISSMINGCGYSQNLRSALEDITSKAMASISQHLTSKGLYVTTTQETRDDRMDLGPIQILPDSQSSAAPESLPSIMVATNPPAAYPPYDSYYSYGRSSRVPTSRRANISDTTNHAPPINRQEYRTQPYGEASMGVDQASYGVPSSWRQVVPTENYMVPAVNGNDQYINGPGMTSVPGPIASHMAGVGMGDASSSGPAARDGTTSLQASRTSQSNSILPNPFYGMQPQEQWHSNAAFTVYPTSRCE